VLEALVPGVLVSPWIRPGTVLRAVAPDLEAVLNLDAPLNDVQS
jgi:hypothetical protein